MFNFQPFSKIISQGDFKILMRMTTLVCMRRYSSKVALISSLFLLHNSFATVGGLTAHFPMVEKVGVYDY